MERRERSKKQLIETVTRISEQADLKEAVLAKSAEILSIARKHGASNIRIFGSVARGNASDDSDIDFLVDAGPATSAWFPAGLILDLENLLGRRVEVVTERALRPDLREYVMREIVPL